MTLLAVHRFDYRDSVFTANDTASSVQIPMQPLTVYPNTNWRGDYQIGTFVTGETQRRVQVPAQPGDNETVDGTVPGETVPAGTGNVIQTYQYCLAAVRWAGKYIWLDHSIRSQPPGSEFLWMGSLVHNKRDLTGNLYMRNRYYDAQAGRFSQEDPIGLAGGLNAYGYAAGDPVSYSDPFGLKVDSVYVHGSAEYQWKVRHALHTLSELVPFFNRAFNAVANSSSAHVHYYENGCRDSGAGPPCSYGTGSHSVRSDLVGSEPYGPAFVLSVGHEFLHDAGDLFGDADTGIPELCGRPDSDQGCTNYYDNFLRDALGIRDNHDADAEEYARRNRLPMWIIN